MSAIKDSTAGMVGAVSAEMTSTTQGFVGAAATSDMYEVEAGKIAQSRAQSPAVKDFAAMMVKAHTGTTTKLKGIIAANSIQVTPPLHLDNRRQGMIADLRGAKAADFDHRYLTQQEAAHKEAEILMRGCQGWRQCQNQGIRRPDLARGATASGHGAEAGSGRHGRHALKGDAQSTRAPPQP